jgi:hypothetical protein
LLKTVLGLTVAIASSVAFAQDPEKPPSAASEPDAAPRLAPAEAVLGVIKEKTESGEEIDDWCDLRSSSKLPGRSVVVVVRKKNCTSRYGGRTRDFLEVFYAGKTRIVLEDAVFLPPDQAKRFAALEPAQLEVSTEDWKLSSLLARKTELEKAMKALNATGRYGVGLLKASIFDVSEYTEGTGFKATVYNSTKKTIKYVTFTVVGLNAVGDPVKGGFVRSAPAPMLRGIGPIEPGETGTYSKDYMWMTDIVESFRISSIKLEYMDGSSKVVSDIKNIRITAQDYDTLTEGDD